MRGISTILAVILIVIIVVAMISLTYTFAVNLFTSTTTGAEEQTTATAERMLKSVTFASASCVGDTIRFTLRHTGTVDIESGDLAAFIDGLKVTSTPNIETEELESGKLSSEFNYTGTYSSDQEVKIRVSAPAGEVERTVTCE
jgi:FlaG/FlaF family flagellin (archaellin)